MEDGVEIAKDAATHWDVEASNVVKHGGGIQGGGRKVHRIHQIHQTAVSPFDSLGNTCRLNKSHLVKQSVVKERSKFDSLTSGARGPKDDGCVIDTIIQDGKGHLRGLQEALAHLVAPMDQVVRVEGHHSRPTGPNLLNGAIATKHNFGLSVLQLLLDTLAHDSWITGAHSSSTKPSRKNDQEVIHIVLQVQLDHVTGLDSSSHQSLSEFDRHWLDIPDVSGSRIGKVQNIGDPLAIRLFSGDPTNRFQNMSDQVIPFPWNTDGSERFFSIENSVLDDTHDVG